MILNTLWKIFEGLSNSGSRELLNQRCNHLLKWSSEWPLCKNPDSQRLYRLKVKKGKNLKSREDGSPPQTSKNKVQRKKLRVKPMENEK